MQRGSGGACLPAYAQSLYNRSNETRNDEAGLVRNAARFDSLRNVRMGCGRSNGNKVGPMTPPNERSGSHRAHDYASTGKQPTPLLAVPLRI